MAHRTVVRRVQALAVLVLLAAVLAACGDDEEPALGGVVREPLLDVSGITLPDALDEAPVAMQAPPGELYLVYFGYTSCPDVCPTTMSDIRVALEDLRPQLAERVTVAMATVDPERDTGEIISEYLGHFFDRSIALRTSDRDELLTATSAFGVQFELEEHEPGEAYDVSHTAVTYVIDDTGAVIVEWPFGFDSAAMTADLTTLLREDPA